MKVVIDCFKQIKGVGKSIGIYNVAVSLVNNLLAEKEETSNLKIKESEIIVLGNKYNKKDFDISGVEFVEVENYNPLNKLQCVLWELFGVSRECKKLKADKILYPRGYCALTHPIDDIVLIHDLIPFYYHEHFPGFFNKIENAYIMNRLKQSAKSSQKIITISEASKTDILNYCGVDENKVTVIHNACNIVEDAAKKNQSENQYICAVTSALPHKNATGIIRSYEEYRKIARRPLDLQIIGIDENYNLDINEETKRQITFHKFIKDDNEVYGLISGAEMFLFLPLIEGFGLPPIEAMQLDVPVICSNVSSLPEVTENAAILVDPNDYEQIGKEILRLQDDDALRRELVSRGRRNIKRFSPKKITTLYWKAIIDC